MSIMIICKTCHRPLDVVIGESGSGYQHAAYDQKFGDGHQAEPVVANPGEARTRCDFCQGDVAHPWAFTAPGVIWMRNQYDDLWLADEECAQLVKGRLWAKLAQDRALPGYERAMGEKADATTLSLMLSLWSKVEKHLVGDPVPPEMT